jgi:DNA uptake protein ComE-like DNA-binding protein
MTQYTRHQLAIILLLVGAAGVGLAIDHWRRARPDLAERLEAFDQTTSAGGARHASPTPMGPVDVNAASESELTRLPGIGPALASRIVAARPFVAVEDLRRVRGLRPATLERLRPLVVAGGADRAF